MVVVSMLPHAEFGSNYHRKDVPHFIIKFTVTEFVKKSMIWVDHQVYNPSKSEKMKVVNHAVDCE